MDYMKCLQELLWNSHPIALSTTRPERGASPLYLRMYPHTGHVYIVPGPVTTYDTRIERLAADPNGIAPANGGRPRVSCEVCDAAILDTY